MLGVATHAYTDDLLRLRNSWPGSGGQLYPQLSQVTSPLSYQAWEDRLQDHPDAVFSHYILEGLQTGFRIGLSPVTCFQSAQSNMQSAREHPQIIDDYLLKESIARCILSPFSPHAMPSIHIHRFGVIPKKSRLSHVHYSTFHWIKWRWPQFNAVADALEWCICRQGVKYIHHYLDDFVVMGPPGSSECQEYLHTLERECAYLGVPLVGEK